MKKVCITIALMMTCFVTVIPAKAQEHELLVLLLNIEKLNQLREILSKMKQGYETIMQGYNKVKDVTSGNFKIHDIFLDGLYMVSPEIRKYHRVPGIIEYQLRLVKEYKAAHDRFRSMGVFTPEQLAYQGRVYAGLLSASLQNLDELLMVLANRTLRMSDDERLTAIDRIYDDMEKKLLFLRSFNKQHTGLALLKLKEKTDLQTSRNLQGITD